MEVDGFAASTGGFAALTGAPRRSTMPSNGVLGVPDDCGWLDMVGKGATPLRGAYYAERE